MPTGRLALSATTVNGKIYVIGGVAQGFKQVSIMFLSFLFDVLKRNGFQLSLE
jgi:hypothetical protein